MGTDKWILLDYSNKFHHFDTDCYKMLHIRWHLQKNMLHFTKNQTKKMKHVFDCSREYLVKKSTCNQTNFLYLFQLNKTYSELQYATQRCFDSLLFTGLFNSNTFFLWSKIKGFVESSTYFYKQYIVFNTMTFDKNGIFMETSLQSNCQKLLRLPYSKKSSQASSIAVLLQIFCTSFHALIEHAHFDISVSKIFNFWVEIFKLPSDISLNVKVHTFSNGLQCLKLIS